MEVIKNFTLYQTELILKDLHSTSKQEIYIEENYIVPEFAGKPSPSPPEAGPVSHHAAIKVYGTVPAM